MPCVYAIETTSQASRGRSGEGLAAVRTNWSFLLYEMDGMLINGAKREIQFYISFIDEALHYFKFI